MPNLAGEYWATDGGSGTKTGLSLANAAAIDPADADDLWTIINAGTVVSDITINVCVDGTASIAATIGISKDATTVYRIVCQGRNAADTADARVVLDAGGGAFSVFTLTVCDYWTWKDLVGFNTDRASGNDGWNASANADNCTWIRCEGVWCYRGMDISASATFGTLINCLARNNVSYGISYSAVTGRLLGCVAHNNGSLGIYDKSIGIRNLSYDNGNTGFLGEQWLQCVSYRNAIDGFRVTSSSFPGVAIDCISAENALWGYKKEFGAHTLYLLRCADNGNTSGRVDSAGRLIADEDDPGLSADPFVEGAPKYILSAGASGATAIDNGSDSLVYDLSGNGWGGNVAVGDRIRFFGGGTGVQYAEEAVVLGISVTGDDNIILVNPQLNNLAQKQCWLGGGNFALNGDASGGKLCRNNAGLVGIDPWSTDYLDIGARQHKRQRAHLIG